uniref:Zinc transporter ZupT n=1 Tax=Auxenochlorella protothecoides TaxID=3075 RepID=A0A1D2A2Q8_AUXPR
MFSEEERWALLLSTFAGMSTTLGAALAIIRPPDDALLSFLLGTAIGVMMLLSVVEMWVHNAMEHGWASTTSAVLLGALFFKVAQPLLASMSGTDQPAGPSPAKATTSAVEAASKTGKRIRADVGPAALAAEASGGGRQPSAAPSGSSLTARWGAGGGEPHANSPPATRAGAGPTTPARPRHPRTLDPHCPPFPRRPRHPSPPPVTTPSATYPPTPPPPSPSPRRPQSPRELLRLGLLMAGTMTLHNLPEGAAVAFSSFTPLGPLMALAIAVHNVPEGVIVAAPVYAATGSRARALGLAAASGLSEPLGALLVICVARPALTATRLQLMLAGVGGLMAAVCVLELWPEARRCRAGGRLAAGIALGAGLMAWTLWLGV